MVAAMVLWEEVFVEIQAGEFARRAKQNGKEGTYGKFFLLDALHCKSARRLRVY